MNRYSCLWGIFAGTLSALMWVLSIPPFEFGEAAYVAFVPLLLWFASRPSWKATILISLGTAFFSWLAILIWLRHVTVFGTIALSAVEALIYLPWFVLARWIQPSVAARAFPARLLAFAGLAGAWVLLEWVRTWLFWGFPWAPLALSQWQRPVVLQVAAWTGAYGVSFMLVCFNCCIAQTLWNRATTKERKMWTGWFSPDLYVGMGILAACIVVFFRTLPRPNSSVELFTAGVVQPYIPAELKWDEAMALEHLSVLEKMTYFVGQTESDLLLWPEAATPWPIIGGGDLSLRVQNLIEELGKPILMGNLAYDVGTEKWYNGAFLMEPRTGLNPHQYIKRELVPFGEYVPKGFRFIEKIVPVGGDFTPETDPGLIPLTVGEQTWKLGSLVCYEDVFPRLGRQSAAAGAQAFFVATNNAWYGEEGGAPQHAAHSVLRAVENRRPVFRCGNAGWSGWIDAYGTIREVILNEEPTIYFRGGGNYTVFQFEDWIRRQSFYTRHGDWFVAVSAGLAMFLPLLRRRTSGSASI
ncbi:MAG: apolipoprotein N-acyltransferase [Coraliomargarita sp.]